MIVERRIHRRKAGTSRQDIGDAEKKWDVFEETLGGFPPKRRYWTMSGVEDQGVFIWERGWESLAEMEKTYDKYGTNEESIATVTKLGMETESIVDFGRTEFFSLWSEDT